MDELEDLRVDVGAAADFEEGRIALVTARGREIALVRWRGRLFGFRNVCPHLGGPLCRGTVGPLLTSARELWSEPVVDGDRVVVTCPWHRWEFDVSTGRALAGPLRLRTYSTSEQDGRARVALD